MLLNNSEPKTLADYVYKSFLLLSKEDKQSVFKNICSEMIRVQVNANIFDDFIYTEDKILDNYIEIVTCPKDKTHDIVKNGKDRHGRQRFKCKSCNETFFATQHTLSSNVTQDISVWFRFISGMLKQENLESLAEACSISVSTAMNWQLRVFEAIRVLEDEIKLSGVIAADETFFDYSLKGKHSDDFIMPHKPRKRGNQNTVKNRNQNSICVLCAIDNENRSFSKIIGFGNSSGDRIVKGFENKLSNSVDVLVTDGAQSFGKSVEEYNIPRWERRPSKQLKGKHIADVSGKFHINKVNSYHERLKRFIGNYKGVSSRRLPGYILMFDFLQNHKGEDMECMCSKILSVMTLPSDEISYKQLYSKYLLPVSNHGEKETWELKVPKKEQKIYIDWYNRVPIAEIIAKYNVNRRKIYTIKDKVLRLNLHDKIIPPEPVHKSRKLMELSAKTLNIYKEYMETTISQTELARRYNMTPQAVRSIIKTVQNRPERLMFPQYKLQSKKKKVVSPDYSKRDSEIYALFQFLNSEGVLLKDIYQQIARQFSLTPKYIQNILTDKRSKDKFATFKYHWSEERKNLPKEEYYKFLEKRNMMIYAEFSEKIVGCSFGNKGKIITSIALKFNISVDQCRLIIRTQRDLRQQEQNQAQEPSDEESKPLH